jgi:hypothetical protein
VSHKSCHNIFLSGHNSHHDSCSFGHKFSRQQKFEIAGATEISNQELTVTCVGAGSVTAVVMLKLKWQRAGNGSVISADWRDSGC